MSAVNSLAATPAIIGTADNDHVVVAFELGKLLLYALPSLSFAELVIEDVLRQWGTKTGQWAQMLGMPLTSRRTALELFVDNYVGTVEGHADLHEDTRAKIWFAHAKALAPADHPIHAEGGPLGMDPKL